MVFPGFGIRPGRKVTWSKVLQVLAFNHSYILVTFMCTLVMCVHLLCAPWSHIRGSSMCIIVCHLYNNPTTTPTGDLSMARLPWGLQKHAIWYVCGPCSHAPYNLLIAMVILLTIP